MDKVLEKLQDQDKLDQMQEIEDEATGYINNHSTKFFALGGIEEIGKNMYVVEQDDELFIIDCGIKFCDNDLPGMDAIICSFDYLKENESKIKGLLITHGHEDHIGGIPYLLMSVKIPKIYAAQLPTEMIKKKLREFPEIKTLPEFNIINDASIIKTQYFHIEFYRVCHSIPDAFGIFIETKNAKIIHSGDFKFDLSTNGDEFDILKLSKFGNKDIDLLVCESTNAETEGFTPSEKYVIDELRNIIETCNGRIFVSTFASNLQRIEEVIQIGIKNNRKICLLGHSMNSNINISIDIGFLNPKKDQIVQPRDLKDYQDNEILILCTGSQGEEMAALNKMAMGENPWITLKPTDTIIFSSNPIPGNYESVERLVNKLYKCGVNVATNSKESKLHTSGHATQIEHQLLFKLVNPQYIIPVHGEFKMLRALKQNAVDSGVHGDNVIQIANGQVVELLNHKLYLTDETVTVDNVYVNNGKIDVDSEGMLKYRKTLSEDGIFSVSIVIDSEKMKQVAAPAITTKGSFYVKDSQPLITKIAYSIKEKIDKYLAKSTYINPVYIRKLVANTAQFFIWSNKRKKPLIRTCVLDISKAGEQEIPEVKLTPEENKSTAKAAA